MAVYRKRSTTSAPEALSSSYLMGSPPIGTSMMTLTSWGTFFPIGISSIRMGQLRWRRRCPVIGAPSAADKDDIVPGRRRSDPAKRVPRPDGLAEQNHPHTHQEATEMPVERAGPLI